MGGKGKTTINQPDPINYAKEAFEFMYGPGSYEGSGGMTDPEFNKKLLESEATFRPEYTALELADIGTMLEGRGDTKGLNALMSDAAKASGETQRGELAKQRADDLQAVQQLAPQLVQAYRDADPESAALADAASARAGEATGIGAKGEELLGSKLQGASAAEKQLQAMGMSQGDLTPTEQEALISGRGTEFIQSTGELTPLEKRRAQQSARQASLARGREMGTGAGYSEMQARMAEELNKQQREIALGSQLLGQEANMRGSRLGQGANMLSQSDALAAQRRKELMQKQQMGAGLIQGEDAIQSGRFGQAFGMNRAIAGDLGSTILGRPSSAVALGTQTLGSAQQGAAGQMGPQLFDPNMGINLAMQDRTNQFNLMGAQAQADASRSSGMMSGIGAALGAFCWVAREVYGEQDPRWVQFRTWMLCESPSWFRRLYVRFGERFAKFISNKPKIKNIIRGWMNNRIK